MRTKPFILLALSLMCIAYFKPALAQEEKIKCNHTPMEVKEIDAQKTLVIKANVPMNTIGKKMGELYGQLFQYIGEKGIQPAGPAFAVYYSWDPNGNVVFETGVPIAAEDEGKENIIYKEFPVMKAVTTLYTGSYENMEPVYNHIQKYMEENELESIGNSWEVYLTDPSKVADPSQNQTLIYFPLK